VTNIFEEILGWDKIQKEIDMDKEKVIEAYEANLMAIDAIVLELDVIKGELEKLRRNLKVFKPIIQNM